MESTTGRIWARKVFRHDVMIHITHGAFKSFLQLCIELILYLGTVVLVVSTSSKIFHEYVSYDMHHQLFLHGRLRLHVYCIVRTILYLYNTYCTGGRNQTQISITLERVAHTPPQFTS